MIIEQKDTYKLFEHFVHCVKNREIQKSQFENLSAKAYLKEFCTFKFGMYRQSGHTINSLHILPRYFQNVFFLYPKDDMARRAQEIYKMHGIQRKNDRCYFSSVRNARDKFRGMQIDAICVDCASFLSNKELEDIYYCIVPFLVYNLGDFSLFLLE